MVAVTALNGSNYVTWRVQCKMALMKDGLWNIVDGTELAPGEDDAGYGQVCGKACQGKASTLPKTGTLPDRNIASKNARMTFDLFMYESP